MPQKEMLKMGTLCVRKMNAKIWGHCMLKKEILKDVALYAEKRNNKR